MLFKRFKKENTGFSLVELLVAISIAAIVAGSIGYFLTTSLRMYNKETVDVTLQQELQVTLNQIMDYAMESETIVAEFDGTYPDYLVLGTFKSKSGVGIIDKTDLDAQIIWQDGNNLYLKKTLIEDFCLSANPADANYRKIDADKIDALSLIPAEGSSSDANILAQYVTDGGFTVTEIGGIVDIKDDSGAVVGQAYENPLSIILSIEFEKTAATANRNKNVKDTVSLRNRVTNDIYVNISGISGPSNHMYSLVKKDSLNIETTTVEMQKNAGIIQIPGSDSGGSSQDLNILEIVPSYSYDYVQYVIGGENGKLLNTDNTTYGASAGIEPISSAEFEGFLIRTAGYRNNNNSTYGMSSFYPNNGADIPAINLMDAKSRVGYYEYVGEANGGVYAIDSYTSELAPASNRGYGDSKPKIKYFVKDTYGNTSTHTGKYYTPSFEFIYPDSVPSDTWFYPIVSNEGIGGDYNKVTVKVDYGNGPVDKEIFEYVGKNNGDYTVTFGNPSQNYNAYYSCYAVKYDPYDSFAGEDGQYYAFTDGEWEHRVDTDSYSLGYDFSDTVKDVVMFSKYHSYSPSKSSDFGWIWHEEDSGALHDDIVNGVKSTASALIESEDYKFYSSPSEYNRIYLKDHIRNIAVNNETFKLFTMQDILELYTPNSMMDIRYGLWDTSEDKYCEINKNALSSWEANGHKISLNVRIPTDVTESDIEDCDMIIIGLNGDGGFDYANTLYGNIRNSSFSASYSSSNDLTFSNAFSIYKKVIANETSIACPYALISVGGSKASINLSRLFEMLFCIVNEDISRDSIVDDTVNKAKLDKIKKQGEDSNYWTVDPSYQSSMPSRVLVQGSGREMFTDFFKSISDDAISKPLYEMAGGLSYPTTDFIYIEESGSNAGSLIVPAKHETIEGYVFNNSSKVISTWGGGGGTGLSAFETNILQWNTNQYLADRYRAAFSGYDKTAFVWNPVYNHNYKFSYSEPQEGIYRNQLVWNQTSDLLHFSKSGVNGALGLQTIRNNTKNDGDVVEADIIGTINYVGADLEEGATERRNNQGDTASKQFDDMPDYSMKIVELPDYIADPSDPGSVVTRKVLYLTEDQFKKAQTEGLYLYVLIKTSKDPSNYNKCVLWYDKNEKDAQGKPLSWRVDYNNDHGASELNDESHENCIKYASGVYPNGSVKTEEAFVREYRYQVPYQYFQNLAPPYNRANGINNNRIVARIDKTSERAYEGNDTLYIYIRDTFDLD